MQFQNDVASVEEGAWGGGGLGFISGSYVLGPGHIFVDVSYGYAPVRGVRFVLNAGGLVLTAGYRFRLF